MEITTMQANNNLQCILANYHKTKQLPQELVYIFIKFKHLGDVWAGLDTELAINFIVK
jgi:hypothetical protein